MSFRLLCLCVVITVSLSCVAAANPLGNVRLSNSTVVVTGLSAGAFMAVQYHIAYSSELAGALIIAGGPFYCARGSMLNAEEECEFMPEAIDINKLLDVTKTCASNGDCDDVSSLSQEKVWLFSGTKDTVVHQGVMEKLASYYKALMPAASVNTTFNLPAEHSWVTNNYGNACGHLGSPFINNCDFDASTNGLSFILGSIRPPVQATGQIKKISQSNYTPNRADPKTISMGPDAYVYVPTACESGNVTCGLAISFHGCQQTINDIGTDFVEHVGLNEVGEANNIVILYPQAIKSLLIPENPEGCFDWWGYTGASTYYNNKGAQMQTVHNMITSLFD